MDFRTDRLGVLIDQLATSAEFARSRLDGVTDDEFLWEPAPGAWSIRTRSQARTSGAFGPGAYVLDFESPEPDPSPVTTIAWRVGHVLSGLAGRYEWTFGDRTREPKDLIDFVPHAEAMLGEMWAAIEQWGDAAEQMSDDELTTPGFGQYPYGFDPELPFIAILWWTNREVIHHLAEVALLRDLYRVRSTP